MQNTKVPCNFFIGTAVLVVIRIMNERPAVLFLFLILCNIDFYRFDENAGWWYIKRNGNARLRRSSPLFGYKAVLASKT